MAKFASFFTFKGETIARMMDKPSDRVGAVRKLTEALGGKLEAYYLMYGEHDGFAIVDVPDSTTAAALSLAVSSTGAFAHISTHELIAPEGLNAVLEKAKKAREKYAPPGA
jgi:uncharacterized protein with GYD domain